MKKELTPIFHEVNIKSRGFAVAEQVLEAIRQGRLKEGDRLPPERELAVQTAVSRPAIREALSALHLAGLVEPKHGEGTFITSMASDLALLTRTTSSLKSSRSMSESLEARRVTEKAAAYLVIKHESAKARGDLRRALDFLERSMQECDFTSYSQANSEFHAAFARATCNSILESALYPLVSISLSGLAQELRRREYDLNPGFFERSFETHQAIFSAVEEGGLSRLMVAIDEHYDRIELSL